MTERKLDTKANDVIFLECKVQSPRREDILQNVF